MNTRPLSLYIDTSVIGGYFDVEFEKETCQLFNAIQQGDYNVIYSSVTMDELLEAPKQVRNLLDKVPESLKIFVELSKEATELGDGYIAEKVVGKTSREDCFHIALATIHKADILVSWNFKHIVNIHRIRRYNSVNLKMGYSTIDIRSPKEIIDYEE